MKRLTLASLVLGGIFTVAILFGVFHNSLNERFSVEFFAASDHKYYENTVATAQVQISPALAWDNIASIWKVIGWTFLIGIWIAIWFVSNDHHLKNSRTSEPRNGFAIILIMLPVLISCLSFFAGYASEYSNNRKLVQTEKFTTWLHDGDVKQRGEKTYVDKSGVLTELFK